MPTTSEHTIEQILTSVVYESPYMRLCEDQIRRPDGSKGTYSYVEKPDFALIIAIENDGLHLRSQTAPQRSSTETDPCIGCG